MLIKTYDFDSKLIYNLKQLTNNRFTIKGSYKIKEYGSYITDIDVETNVVFNKGFLNKIINMIESSRSFIFIQLSLGFKKEYVLPWKIDNYGGCEYDPKKVRIWYENFKKMKLVPDDVYKFIEDKLFSETISIKNLIDIENEIYPYSELIWRQDDIKKGYVYFMGTKYELLDMLSIENPVFELLYKYKGEFCLIDLALKDESYNYEFTNDMYKYYTKDWYKIMKLFRWKIQKEYQAEYRNIMKNIDIFIAIYNRLILIEKVYKYRLLPSKDFYNIDNDIKIQLTNINIKLDNNTKTNLLNIVNKYLEKYIDYFRSKLNSNFIDKFESQYQRSLEAEMVTKDIITKRVKNNIKCPFFRTDIEDYKRFIKITKKLSLDLEHVIDCFIKISEETGKSIKVLLNIAEDELKI